MMTIRRILFEGESFLRLVNESANTHYFETKLQHFFKPTYDSFAAAHILSFHVLITSCAHEETYNVYWRDLKFGWCYSTNLFLEYMSEQLPVHNSKNMYDNEIPE